MAVYDTLNKPQKEAVFHTEGPLLFLAGRIPQFDSLYYVYK